MQGEPGSARRGVREPGNTLSWGWGCFLPHIAKYFSTWEVNESIAQLGTTLHQQFQLVS